MDSEERSEYRNASRSHRRPLCSTPTSFITYSTFLVQVLVLLVISLQVRSSPLL
jgi:hypothetical protein